MTGVQTCALPIFLAPAEVLLHCRCVKKNMIIKLCGLSDEAATYREERLRDYVPDHKYLDVNQEILKQFYNFINSKDFFVNLHHKICPVCKNYILSTREHYCRICGSQITDRTLTKGIVYHDGPEIGKQKRTPLCPKCLQPQDAKTGSTCIHCGSSLINQCSDPTCALTHAGSSRYCYKCGSPNAFFLDDILPDWKTAQKSHEDLNLLKHLLENDKDTGRILDEWQYLLSFMKEDGEFLLYTSLKQSIAKIDYDTLYIYSGSSAVKDWIKNEEAICAYIMKLMRKKLNMPILEILHLEVGPDGTISCEE